MRRITSSALLVRSVPYGEADVVATFFTATDGKLSAMVRGARRSQKRFGGALEPIHGLVVVLEDRGRELTVLKEARIERPRMGITGDLARMESAGHALRWVRHLSPPRTPEPAAWSSLVALLDTLDGLGSPSATGSSASRAPIAQHLARFGFQLLADMGYGLDLERCVVCGKPCPAGRPAFVDAARGGLVCMGCGGARRTLRAELRSAALALVQPGDADEHAPVLSPADASELVDVVEEAMAAHTDFDRGA